MFAKSFFPIVIPGKLPTKKIDSIYLALSNLVCLYVVGTNIVLTLIFGIFAVCMITDQFIAIRSSASIIDRKQGNSFEEVR